MLAKAVSTDITPVVYYALKLLKSQLRHLGLWKRRNMALVSAMYLYIPPKMGPGGRGGSGLASGGSADMGWATTPGLNEAVAEARSSRSARTSLGDASVSSASSARPWAQRARLGRMGGIQGAAAAGPDAAAAALGILKAASAAPQTATAEALRNGRKTIAEIQRDVDEHNERVVTLGMQAFAVGAPGAAGDADDAGGQCDRDGEAEEVLSGLLNDATGEVDEAAVDAWIARWAAASDASGGDVPGCAAACDVSRFAALIV